MLVHGAQENDFRDLIVLSEEIDADLDSKELCARLEQEDIYVLDPAMTGSTAL